MGSGTSKQEFFLDPLRPERPPLTSGEGLQALQLAESIDRYQNRISNSNINRMARMKQPYLPSLLTVKRKIPTADSSKPWPNGQIIWMEPDADSGLPHTRPPYYICISRKFPENLLSTTLLHERIHVSQRLHPKEWNKILEEAWSMKPWKGQLPSDIDMRRRLNPDLLMSGFFAWKNEFVPLALFQSTTQPKLHTVDIVWWQISTRTLHRNPPPGWVDFFGSVHPGHEHPYELIAYSIEHSSSTKAFNSIKLRLDTLPSSEV